MYHQIVVGEPKDIHAVTSQAFADQMRWLHEHAYQTVAVDELLADKVTRQSAATSPRIAISFDDGYLHSFTNAFPVLSCPGMNSKLRFFWLPGASEV